MIPEFPNSPDELQRRLDRAVPPDTRRLPPAKDDDPLVEAARQLAETPPFTLSNDAVDRIEGRLMAEIDTVDRFDRISRRRVPSRAVRWLTYAAAACLVLVMLAGGATYASADSLPGDPLYGVKRAVERVQLAVASGESEASLRVDLAERRVNEFSALLDRGEVYPRALREATQELERALAFGQTGALGQQIAVVAQEQEALSLQAQARSSESERAQLQSIIDESRELLERIPTPPVSPDPTDAPPIVVTASPTVTDEPTLTVTPSPTSRATSPPPPTPRVLPEAPVIAPTRTPPGLGDDPGLGDNPPGLGGEHPGVGNDGQPPGLSDDEPAPPVENLPPVAPPVEQVPVQPPADEPPPPPPVAPTSTPPGLGDDPGLGDNPPGLGDDPPGSSGSAPGLSDNPPPGQGGVPPGQQG